MQATELIFLITEDWRENPAQHNFCRTYSRTRELPGVFWQFVSISVAKENNGLGRDHCLFLRIRINARDDLLSANESCLLHVSPGRDGFKWDRF